MPQIQAAQRTCSKVQKILKDPTFRQAAEHTWKAESKKAEGLEVLARCRALNEFVRKVGLHILGVCVTYVWAQTLDAVASANTSRG